jgi:hypothetical protein
VERELQLTPKVIDSALPAPLRRQTLGQPDRSTQADPCFALSGAEEAVDHPVLCTQKIAFEAFRQTHAAPEEPEPCAMAAKEKAALRRPRLSVEVG